MEGNEGVPGDFAVGMINNNGSRSRVTGACSDDFEQFALRQRKMKRSPKQHNQQDKGNQGADISSNDQNSRFRLAQIGLECHNVFVVLTAPPFTLPPK